MRDLVIDTSASKEANLQAILRRMHWEHANVSKRWPEHASGVDGENDRRIYACVRYVENVVAIADFSEKTKPSKKIRRGMVLRAICQFAAHICGESVPVDPSVVSSGERTSSSISQANLHPAYGVHSTTVAGRYLVQVMACNGYRCLISEEDSFRDGMRLLQSGQLYYGIQSLDKCF